MSPALTPLVSALERAAVLMEKGMAPAKALRQVSQEVVAHAAERPTMMIPMDPYSSELGVPLKRVA